MIYRGNVILTTTIYNTDENITNPEGCYHATIATGITRSSDRPYDSWYERMSQAAFARHFGIIRSTSIACENLKHRHQTKSTI